MKKTVQGKIDAVVIGTSAGGIKALNTILTLLPASFLLPIIVVLHIPSSHPSTLSEVFKHSVKFTVKEAEEKDVVKNGTLYFAPPGYHLLIESDHSLSFSIEEPVCFSRPSIDVTFESAADVFGKKLIGILLTGANTDGSNGLKRIREKGGTTIIQDPKTAEQSEMPRSGIPYVLPENIMNLNQIASYLTNADQQNRNSI